MAGIINGRVVASSTGHEPIQFTKLPTPIKYLLLKIPTKNIIGINMVAKRKLFSSVLVSPVMK